MLLSGSRYGNNRIRLKLRFILATIIAIVSFSIYSNSIKNEYVLDDISAIKENFVVKQGISAIPLILKTPYRFGYWVHKDNLYRPLSLVMFAVEWQFFPDNPSVSHFINVLLFTISTTMLFLMLCKMFQGNFIVPFVCSLLFAAHPIHTEVIANIKSRDEILALLFLITTIWSAIIYFEKKSMFMLAGSAISYGLALLSKESAITFLLLVPAAGYFFTKPAVKNFIFFISAFSAVSLIYILVRYQVLGALKFEDQIILIDNFLTGAPDLIVRLASAIFILGKYFFLLLFPHPLSFDYSFNTISLVSWTNPLVLLAFLFYVFITVYAFIRFRKKDAFSFAIFLFLLPLSLVSNIFTLIESSMAERFLFIPSLGFCLGISLLLAKTFKTGEQPVSDIKGFLAVNIKMLAIVVLILIPYSAKTVSRNKDWKDSLTLYSKDVLASTNSARVHFLLGNELIKFTAEQESDPGKKKKLLLDGIARLIQAIKIYPEYSDAYNQVGVAYYKMRDFEKARSFFLEAVKYNNENPEVKSNLGSVYFETKQLDKAEEMYRQALSLNPNHADALRNLGSVCGETGRLDEALTCFQKALKITPDNPILLQYIGMTYRFKNDEANTKIFLDKDEQLNSRMKKR